MKSRGHCRRPGRLPNVSPKGELCTSSAWARLVSELVRLIIRIPPIWSGPWVAGPATYAGLRAALPVSILLMDMPGNSIAVSTLAQG